MSTPQSGNGSQPKEMTGPPLGRDASGRIDVDTVPDVIQWFLDFDQRVAIVRHPRVEEVFHWKQNQSELQGEKVFHFDHAEDRLAIGIISALSEHSSERQLHDWIGRLLNALDSAMKTNEATAEAYGLDLSGTTSTVDEAQKIPTERGRHEFLTNCWLESLCSAEARVLGWLYKEFYGRPFAP